MSEDKQEWAWGLLEFGILLILILASAGVGYIPNLLIGLLAPLGIAWFLYAVLFTGRLYVVAFPFRPFPTAMLWDRFYGGDILAVRMWWAFLRVNGGYLAGIVSMGYSAWYVFGLYTLLPSAVLFSLWLSWFILNSASYYYYRRR